MNIVLEELVHIGQPKMAPLIPLEEIPTFFHDHRDAEYITRGLVQYALALTMIMIRYQKDNQTHRSQKSQQQLVRSGGGWSLII